MKRKFSAEIKKHEGINGAYVEIPFDVESIFGTKRVKVKASFDGKEYRGSIVRMADCYMLGLTQSLRKDIGKDFGDTVTVEVEKDEEERTVVMPEDFLILLKTIPGALEYFEKLSYTHKKEYIQWIGSAKKAETRKNRIEKAVIMLSKNKKLK